MRDVFGAKRRWKLEYLRLFSEDVEAASFSRIWGMAWRILTSLVSPPITY